MPNRNVESHFSRVDHINIKRSRFDRSHSHKTTFNVGDIIPFYVDEVLPGDTFDVKTSKVVRMQTLLTPVMDNIYLDTYYFYVPMRLLWNHTKEFFGENTTAPWIPQTTYQVPQLISPSGGWNIGTIADYFGIPTGVSNLSVNALPFRAYALIMNEWFRDQNLTTPCNVPVDDTTRSGVNTGSYVTDTVLGGLPYKASKYHDYFTSALPNPQKGPEVTIPLGTKAPVIATPNLVPASTFTGNPLSMKSASDISVNVPGTLSTFTTGSVSSNGVTPTWGTGVAPANLWADLSLATAASINQLRMAFQLQKFYERAARGGSRYRELLRAHFGVTTPDSRMQIPEYLGGNRIGLSINQVVQSSGTTSYSGMTSTPQGTTTAFSQTVNTHSDFVKSFVEHGFVIGVCVARYDHTYQQGIERFWSRHDMIDYYFPEFANIGEQAIKNREIFAQGTTVDEQVFGYQEAFADYRYKPSRVSGEMRSSATLSLDVWHLADDYASQPYLSDTWIREDKTNVDRVLAVQSSTSNQLFADFFIKNIATRPMPLYSIPGLLDHH